MRLFQIETIISLTFTVILSGCGEGYKLNLSSSLSESSNGIDQPPQDEPYDNHPIASEDFAELPRVYVDTSLPNLNGNVINVRSGENLQTAINEAQPGDTIVLEAGATWVGNFTLPAKNNPENKWIIIRTSNLAGITAEGVRVTPTHSATMPKILTNNVVPALKTRLGANYYRLIGIEIGITDSTSLNYGILELGSYDTDQNSLDLVAHHLVIDRCYIRGTSTAHTKRGIALNSAHSAVINSYISEIHGWGQDAQGIGGHNGPGPYKINNNYIEGAGENVLFGGSDPFLPNVVPSDIEVRGNYMSKPLAWRDPVPGYESNGPWLVKNVFELKSSQRVLIENNIFENSWTHGQTGFAILFTVRNQDGNCTYCVIQDVVFRNNIVRRAGSGISILGTDNVHPTLPTRRIVIRNNLIDEIDGRTYNSYGTCFMIGAKDLFDVVIDHNTCFQSQHIILAGNYSSGVYEQVTNLRFTNNLMNHNNYGIFGQNSSIGSGTIQNYFPDSTFEKNIIIRTVQGVPASRSYPNASVYPNVTGSAFLFVDSLADANLAKVGFATDGTDVGYVP